MGVSSPSIAVTPGGVGIQLGSVYMIPSTEQITVYVPPTTYDQGDVQVGHGIVTELTTGDSSVTLLITGDGNIHVITVEDQ